MSDVGDLGPVPPRNRPAAKKGTAPKKATAKVTKGAAKATAKLTGKVAKAPARSAAKAPATVKKAAARTARTPRPAAAAPPPVEATEPLDVEPQPPEAPRSPEGAAPAEPVASPPPEPPPAPPRPDTPPPPSGPPSWSAAPSYPPPPPPGGSYPPPPSYAPTGYGGPPAAPKPKTDGLAIAGLVLGILSIIFAVAFGVFAIVGLVLSLVSLRRIKREGLGGKGLALGGLITSIIGLLLSIGFVILVFWAADNIDYVSWEQVDVGDCVNEEGNFEVLVTPCFVSHEAEVYAVVTTGLPEEAPTDEDLDVLFDQFCRERFRDYVGISYDDSVYSSSIITTQAQEWNAGNRAVVCVIQTEDGSDLEDSVRNSRQ